MSDNLKEDFRAALESAKTNHRMTTEETLMVELRQLNKNMAELIKAVRGLKR